MWVADEGKMEVRCCSGCYSIGKSESSPALIVLSVVYKIEGTTHLVREQKWVVHKLGSTTPWTSRALSLLLFLLKPRSTSHSLLLYPILYEYDSITITPQHLHINIQSSSISIPSLFYFKKVVVYWIRCCVGASAYFTYCLRSFHSVSCDVTARGRQLLPPITNWHNLDYRISNVNNTIRKRRPANTSASDSATHYLSSITISTRCDAHLSHLTSTSTLTNNLTFFFFMN